MNLQKLFRSLVPIALAGMWLTASADDSQAVITWQGAVDVVNVARHEIVVGDKAFYLESNTPVKTAGGLSTTVTKLRRGSQVEVVLLNGAIQEIRILK